MTKLCGDTGSSLKRLQFKHFSSCLLTLTRLRQINKGQKSFYHIYYYFQIDICKWDYEKMNRLNFLCTLHRILSSYYQRNEERECIPLGRDMVEMTVSFEGRIQGSQIIYHAVQNMNVWHFKAPTGLHLNTDSHRNKQHMKKKLHANYRKGAKDFSWDE